MTQVNSTNSGTGALSDGSRVAVDSGDGFFTYSGNINSLFTANEIKYLRVDPIDGTANNTFEIDYIEVTMSNTAPALVSISPVDDATGIASNANLTITFDELIFLNTTGSITIKNLTTAADTVISLPGPDSDGTLSVAGRVLTIDPTANLGAPGDQIAIEISADAIKDADDTFYPGILSTDVPNWSFTIDNIPPAPSYFHPIPGSGQAPLDGALFIAFDSTVLKGTGNLVIHKADDSVIETIDVTSGNVVVSGTKVTITPTVALAYGTSYYVKIDSGAFTDVSGNSYAGISDSASWTFSTIANEAAMLFGDSFNRGNGTDLNASARGKYGSLGALIWNSKIVDDPATSGVANILLTDGQLLLASNENPATSGAVVYPNYNFTDAAITAAGGFSVTVDLNTYLSGGSGRYMIVAVGQTAAELAAQTSTSALGSPGDLVVGYRKTNDTLEIVANDGTPIVVPAPPNAPTKMRIDYSLPNFTTGSTVGYKVFFDDSLTAFAEGTFTWSGTNENYISLSSNLINTFTVGERHALFDNLQIRKFAAVAPGYATWASLNGASVNLNEDDDGEGVSNGIEYFLVGPSGLSTGFTPLPGVVNDAGVLSVTWTKAASYTGSYGPTGYEVEVSSTLGGWTLAPGVDVTFPSANEVKYTFPAGTRNFARLKVTGP